jgi:hypothetical protein
MELERYVNGLQEQLEVASAAGGEEARALAERLTAPLDAAVRLMLLDALSAAASEITRELAPGSVDLRLRGGEPEFVVTARSAEIGRAVEGGVGDAPGAAEARGSGGSSSGQSAAGEGGQSRVNLRLSDQLKQRVEQAADRDGLSINAWLVRAAAAAVERAEAGGRTVPGGPRGDRRFTGWGH